MWETTEREAVRRFGTARPAFNYRWEHVTTVVTLALKLADLTHADREVVEAAAWLHDVRKEQENHSEEGANFARRFLPQTDFPPDKIELVAQAIETHQGLWRDEPLTNLEAMVLWDADKLTKMGLTAVFHWAGLALTERGPEDMADLIEQGRSADWMPETAASMHTKPARRAAQSRLKAYHKLWQDLETELSGDDLVP